MNNSLFRPEVPVHFNGTVLLVKNVTKYTICSDVIHMLLLQLKISVDRIPFYALFETTGDLERMLSGRTRILKAMRSWGCEKDNFRFELKSIESDDHCRLTQYRNIINSHCKTTDDMLQLPGDNVDNFKTCSNTKSNGKQIFFKKYLSNLIRFRKPKRRLQKNSKTENIAKTGQIEESRDEINSNVIAEIDTLLHNQFDCLDAQGRYYWDSNSESEEESDMIEDWASFHGDSDLNNAFLNGVTITDLGRKVTAGNSCDYSNVCCGDLNNAFVDEHYNWNESSHLSDISEDHLESFSNNSGCELDRNITSCDIVRNMFCRYTTGGAITEDDEMVSFMRTHIYDSNSEVSLNVMNA